jgi:hypothetical protein
VYATHIFDGMEAWPSHVAYVERGVLKRAGKVEDVPVRLAWLASRMRRCIRGASHA